VLYKQQNGRKEKLYSQGRIEIRGFATREESKNLSVKNS
jgi:hypothetical protein